jgi:flagellar hook assembly protein FlgD
MPTHTALLQNYPNPFNPETWLPYKLAQDALVTARIYNTKGQLIRLLYLGEKQAGNYVTKEKAAYWDGRDELGQKVASGVYFYALQVENPKGDSTGKYTETRRMVILK